MMLNDTLTQGDKKMRTYELINSGKQLVYSWYDDSMGIEVEGKPYTLSGIGTHKETGEVYQRYSREDLVKSHRWGYTRRMAHVYYNITSNTLSEFRPKIDNPNYRPQAMTGAGNQQKLNAVIFKKTA
jgi:hypothetical protein